MIISRDPIWHLAGISYSPKSTEHRMETVFMQPLIDNGCQERFLDSILIQKERYLWLMLSTQCLGQGTPPHLAFSALFEGEEY